MWLASELAEAQKLAREVGFGNVPTASSTGPRSCADARTTSRTSAPTTHVRFEEFGIELIAEYGQFVDAHTIVAGERTFTAPHIVIATGSRPRRLSIPGG